MKQHRLKEHKAVLRWHRTWCLRCTAHLSSLKSYWRHVRRHNSSNFYPCTIAGCHKRFSTKANGKRHQKEMPHLTNISASSDTPPGSPASGDSGAPSPTQVHYLPRSTTAQIPSSLFSLPPSAFTSSVFPAPPWNLMAQVLRLPPLSNLTRG